MLKHLPRCGMGFFLHIFNLSMSLHFFPSIWKASSVIPIHKMEKPLDSSTSFHILKIFELPILSRLVFFQESSSILSPRPTSFHPGLATLDQILFVSQSILDGFNESKPGSRRILATVDFSKAFNSVWHPAFFHILISAGLPPCFACGTQSFLYERRVWVVYQNHKSCSI